MSNECKANNKNNRKIKYHTPIDVTVHLPRRLFDAAAGLGGCSYCGKTEEHEDHDPDNEQK